MRAIVFLLLATVFPASARLGETVEECTQRYGEPVKKKDQGNVIYHKAGLLVVVGFLNGKAATITFCKSERDIIDKPEPLSEAEVETLLEANKGNSVWKKKTEGAAVGFTKWEREDGSAGARYGIDRLLVMVSEEYLKHSAAAKAAKEKKALEGF